MNSDFSKSAISRAVGAKWAPSPAPGVKRRMLDRIGGEKARVTSIVRYAPKSSFSEHVHVGGEEFFVLDGVFSDFTGDFGPGTYVRNSVGSKHAPWSKGGCTIFVKLMQMDLADTATVRIQTSQHPWIKADNGLYAMPLYSGSLEEAALWRLNPGCSLSITGDHRRFEFLVLSGDCRDDEYDLTQYDWVRRPVGYNGVLTSQDGCTLFLKRDSSP